MKAVYRLQLMKEEGEHINTFGEDVKSLFNGKFYITLLTLPSIGVIMMNIIPIIFMSCVAFTNYDMDHMPPNYLFTWVGLRNFKNYVYRRNDHHILLCIREDPCMDDDLGSNSNFYNLYWWYSSCKTDQS